MRGTPLLVQIFVIYYGLPSLGISLDPTPAGVIALSANVAAYMSKACAARSTGSHAVNGSPRTASGCRGRRCYVIGPQALRIAVPSLSNSLISLIKDTSLVSVITVTELLRSAQEVIAATYQPLPLYLAAAYWILCQILEWVQRWYESACRCCRGTERTPCTARACPAPAFPLTRPNNARRAARAASVIAIICREWSCVMIGLSVWPARSRSQKCAVSVQPAAVDRRIEFDGAPVRITNRRTRGFHHFS